MNTGHGGRTPATSPSKEATDDSRSPNQRGSPIS